MIQLQITRHAALIKTTNNRSKKMRKFQILIAVVLFTFIASSLSFSQQTDGKKKSQTTCTKECKEKCQEKCKDMKNCTKENCKETCKSTCKETCKDPSKCDKNSADCCKKQVKAKKTKTKTETKKS
jgi:hypothetical protein